MYYYCFLDTWVITLLVQIDNRAIWLLFFQSCQDCHEKSVFASLATAGWNDGNTWTVKCFSLWTASGEVWTTYISHNSKTMVFISFHFSPSVCIFSPLVKSHPWPFSSPFFQLLSSLPLIFFWISAVPPNPSVPLSCLYFSVSSFCALTRRWLRGLLACLSWLSAFLRFSIQYLLLSLAMDTRLRCLYS